MDKRYSNFHTHTVFCDGTDTPEALVQEALRLGCPAIGFSGHSYAPYDTDYCMSPEETEAYIGEVRRLQKAYGDKIRIYLGVEQDYFSEASTEGYDYVIGSVHYVQKDGVYLPVDAGREKQQQAVQAHYGGDWYAFAEDYYRLAADLRNRTRCDIVGHFDLITKFNEGQELFKTDHPRYKAAVAAAIDALCRTPAVFEINTGAISRGYRTEPYPAADIVAQLRKRGVRRILSSDCHAGENLLFGFEDFADYLR